MLTGGGDTWEYDDNDWVRTHPANQPPSRSFQSLAYDVNRSCMVMFGGFAGQLLFDLWELPSNRPPSVSATFSPAAPLRGQSVTLAAAFSDPDGDTPTWRWWQTFGPPVALTGTDSAVATFASTVATSLGFEVVAEDGHEGFAYALATINISPPPPPAGIAATASGVRVLPHTTVNGERDEQLDRIGYARQRDSRRRAPANLVARGVSGPAAVRAGELLAVTAALENAGNQDVTATFSLAFHLSRDPVLGGPDVALGTGSVAGLAAGGRAERFPSLTVPEGTAAGAWYLLLDVDPANATVEVSDSDNTIASEQPLQVTSRPPDTTPQVQFSSATGRVLGGGMSAASAPEATQPVFVCRKALTAADNGTSTVSLRATDRSGNALGVQPSNNTFTVAIAVNRPPVASAGPGRTAWVGTRVTLAGSASDPDGDALTYAWTGVPSHSPSLPR